MEEMSLSNALFSKVQQRVLALIFGHSDRSFYTSKIVRSIHSGTGAVERELSRLRRSGLVSVERIGNQKHYRANHQSPIFEELQSLVLKTVALTEPLRKALQPYSDKIDAAFVYGSVAKGTDTARSDIDLMVIGDELNYSELYMATQNAENILGRKVSPIFLSPDDWKRKVSQKGSFVHKISALPMMFLFGSEEDLMGKQELDNLVRIKRLKLEPGSRAEFDGMVRSARTHLADAQNESIDTDSQFDLAYGAAHRLALAALRQQGYRSEDRITVFQTLVHTIGTDKADLQVFLKAHNERNLAEYEGRLEIDEKLLANLIRCTKKLEADVAKLEPPPEA